MKTIKPIVKTFSRFVNENLEGEEPKLRPGQKAAVSRGDDILTDEQYAACYLNAVENLGRSEDQRGRGDSGLTRNALKMAGNQDENDFRKVSGAKLSIYLELKPQTVERTVSKFKLLLHGQREGTASNVIWPELAAIFDQFESMQKAEVLAMAENALNYSADDTAYQAYLDKASASASKTKETKVNKTKTVGMAVKSLYNSLKGGFPEDKAARMAVAKVAQEKGMDPAEVKTLAMEYMKTEPTLRKLFK